MPPPARRPDGTNIPPFETANLRANLAAFLDDPFSAPSGGRVRVGHYKRGVCAFFDYDGEPIYVGQTNDAPPTLIAHGVIPKAPTSSAGPASAA